MKKGPRKPRPSSLLELLNLIATPSAVRPPPSPSLFQAYLLAGERVLWTGQPKQGIAFHRGDAFLVPFSFAWLGFVIYFFFGFAAGVGGDAEIDPFLALFLAFGIYFAFGRFIHDALIRSGISYAVTDQRVMVLKQNGKLSSHDLHRLPMLELTEHGDGTGSISFEKAPSFWNYGRAGGFDMWVPSLAAASQFFRIENPRRVYQLIRDNAARV
jgi:hypothetical protein